MIEYETIENRRRPSDVMRVRLDGKIVGTIRLVEGGFTYVPNGQRKDGKLFRSVREVQTSLESDEHEQPTTVE